MRTHDVVPDKVCHISNMHAHTEVPSRQGLDGQGVIQIPGCGGVYAEQPAGTPAGYSTACKGVPYPTLLRGAVNMHRACITSTLMCINLNQTG